ncbi:MAG TPA: nucleotidyltransferase domain-containing protein [Candidatus Humimicrobiaceae bacterium]
MEKILHFPVQNIRRELLKLEKTGIFKREKSGNQVYYFLNTESPIFKDLKNIIAKTIGVENQLRVALSNFNGIKKAFIFGSFADGTVDALSDIDIMIVGDINEDALIEIISNLESKFEREINYHIFSKKEFIKRKQEKDSFISRILSKPTISLVEDHENISGIY